MKAKELNKFVSELKMERISLQGKMIKWFTEKRENEIMNMRFKLTKGIPEIGERCIISFGVDKPVYFGYRKSQNYYTSGNLTIPVDTINMEVVTIKVANEQS